MCKDNLSFETLAFKALETLKHTTHIFLLVILILVLCHIGMNIYWITQFLKYDYQIVEIDGTDGSTNAYIEGDNNTINNKEK